jgi:hypothetical protein
VITLADAILDINPNAIFSASHDINFAHKIIWREGTEAISVDVLTTKYNELVAEYDSQEYARNRKAEYDQLNQFEMQFDDDRDGTTTWVDKINEIKARYPK